jgi:small conductance mechanosensitive channel
MNGEIRTLDHLKAELLELALRFGPKLAVALLILAVGFLVGRYVARALDRALHRLQMDPPVRQLLARLARLVVLGLFLILALQNLGVELLPLVAGLSVAGAGVALATQGVLSNMVAGLVIIFTRPYRVGEYVEIAGVEGTVEAISMSSTTLVHADRSRIVVPNRKIVGEILHNYGSLRQLELQVGVAYGADLARALAAIRARVAAHPRVLADPVPVVQVLALADSAVRITVRPWVAVADYATVPGELNVAIVAALAEAGIAIPLPQREVRLLAERR